MTEGQILRPTPKRFPIIIEPSPSVNNDSQSASLSNEEIKIHKTSSQKHYWTKEEVLS